MQRIIGASGEYEIIHYDEQWDEFVVNVYRKDGTLEIANNVMDGEFIRGIGGKEETVKIEESEYCRGFADATGLGIDEAAEQISAMGNYEVDDWENYDEGYQDGKEFNKIEW